MGVAADGRGAVYGFIAFHGKVFVDLCITVDGGIALDGSVSINRAVAFGFGISVERGITGGFERPVDFRIFQAGAAAD